ncbi:MAG: BPTD_3080 family restriction endonuclease [Thermodesulfobacteriota bacterium]
MAQKVIDTLIINNPYEEPKQYWKYIRETQEFELLDGRRDSGYWKATQRTAKNVDDPGEFVTIDLVNIIRPRVRKWRVAGYPNCTGTTRKLLQYWNDTEQREQRFFFCQLEAVETAIWLTEAPEHEKQGIQITGDGSDWQRLCLKLATGTGKTVVMAMLIAWQALNKIASPKDQRFSKNILIIAPGLTVHDRLQVLLPEKEDNFYQVFNIVDSVMWQELLQVKIRVRNWHKLAPINENYGPKVVKKGTESAEAFVRRALPDFGNASNILVINDEAHHCHRPTRDEEKSEQEKATIWVSGIDRIHEARGVLKCFDLTATPFKPTGRNIQGEMLFPWIVCDFGLNDAIESGLVKTPKVAVRDDSMMGSDLKSKLFHIYPEVKDDLNKRAEPHEGLPDLVRNAVNILGGDWLKEKEKWEKQNPPRETPPVMIMICNRTETAARLEYSFTNGYFAIEELGEKNNLLRIDQDALDKLEADESDKLSGSKKELVMQERERLNTVGKKGRAGADVQCVIGVNMLSEGWDARTVTHIIGLRAFTSQLLCEQVIGRGLRRISYDTYFDEKSQKEIFAPEYVTVFGVPFTFLPVEQKEGEPKEEKPKTKIQPIPERTEKEIKWPHVLRVDYKLCYFIEIDWSKVSPLVLSAEDAPTVVEVAPVIDGKPKFDQLSEIDLEKLAEQHRLQKYLLQGAVRLHEQFGKNWPGDSGSHINQAYRIIEEFITSSKLEMKLPLFYGTERLRNILIALNMQKIINHVGNAIRSTSKESPSLILDPVRPVRSTATSMIWWTTKPTQPIQKSQISHIVVDSGWEKVGFEFERNRIQGIMSWVKNDHLGFEIYYLWQGQTKTYYPDFIIRFEDRRNLILEVKGQTTEQDKAKWQAAKEWVNAVNADGRFGKWEFKVLDDPKNIFEIVK